MIIANLSVILLAGIFGFFWSRHDKKTRGG
jgi:hypothetical protein